MKRRIPHILEASCLFLPRRLAPYAPRALSIVSNHCAVALSLMDCANYPHILTAGNAVECERHTGKQNVEKIRGGGGGIPGLELYDTYGFPSHYFAKIISLNENSCICGAYFLGESRGAGKLINISPGFLTSPN